MSPFSLPGTTIAPASIRPNALVLAGFGMLLLGLLTFVLQRLDALLPLAALCVILGGLLLIVRPVIGLIALPLVAAFVHVKVSTGTNSPIVASLGLAGLLIACWGTHQLTNRRGLSYLPRWVAIAGVAFVAVTFFSLAWGQVDLDPRVVPPPYFYRVQLAAAMLTAISIGLLFVGADLFRQQSVRNAVAALVAVTGMLALPFRLLQADVPIVQTGGLFGMWFVALCWSNALVNRRLPDWLRLILGACAGGWLYMAFVVEGSWISGWLPGVVAILSITLLARPRLGIVMTLLSVVLVAVYLSALYQLLITDQTNQGSIGGEFGRLELWKRNITLLHDHLLFGTGPGGYALYYLAFIPDKAMSTHSNAIDILAQQGVVGLAVFGVLLGALSRMGWKTVKAATDPSDVALSAAVVGAIPAVLASLFLGDWLIPFIYNQTIAGFDHSMYSWLMFAALCGLYAQQQPMSETSNA
jgi:hypothetical protein